MGWNSFIPPLSIVGGFSWAWQWRNLGSEVGNINPEYKDPPFSNPFVILALQKSKFSFSKDAALPLFTEALISIKTYLVKLQMLSRNMTVAIKVFLHL